MYQQNPTRYWLSLGIGPIGGGWMEAPYSDLITLYRNGDLGHLEKFVLHSVTT